MYVYTARQEPAGGWWILTGAKVKLLHFVSLELHLSMERQA